MSSSGWRPMRIQDIPAVSAISDAVHGAFTEPAAIYAERLRLYPSGCFVFGMDGVVAGYLIGHPWRSDVPPRLGECIAALPEDPDIYYLHDLAIVSAARGSGAGAAATRLVVAAAEAAGYADICLVAVNGAESFWAAHGFAIDGGAANSAGGHSYGPSSFFMRRRIG